jgi:CNT family concentrative nucleoside transporter
MCGFTHFGSLDIMIGGLATMLPERRADMVSLGLTRSYQVRHRRG